jgi:hypothetical protein
MLLFGQPATSAPAVVLGIVAPLFAILCVALVIATAVLWIRRSWSLPGRVLVSLIALAAVAVTALLVRWNMVTLLL